jgi:hypothetical protein
MRTLPILNKNFTAALAVSLQVFAMQPSDSMAEIPDDEISEITVSAQRVANDRPAGTYTSPVTALRFDPLTELQSRGLAEGQADVTVRGGVFENTGFKLGAVTIMDPQTGHYAAELPVDPALMSLPEIFTGIDAAVEGFNASVATVAYGIGRVRGEGEITVGLGSDSLHHEGLRFGYVTGTGVGLAVSAAQSAGDGTLPFGDHEFARYNVQLQAASGNQQTDLVVAYQDKFFGWPGAYTGFASLPEVDDTQTTLVLVNQRRATGNGWIEFGAFYRRLEDDYDFNRLDFETGVPGAFEHETRVLGAGFQGLRDTGRVGWRYGGQLSMDELVRSTDLTNGQFTDRMYATLTIAPEFSTSTATGTTLTWRVGVTGDYSNRDGSRFLPLAGVSHTRDEGGVSTTWSFEYAETAQLPGYTALNSNPSGLFGGNPLLGREIARQLSVSLFRETEDWQLRSAVFARRDEDLVDWTYATGAPFARQANPVDLDVVGLELTFLRGWDDLDIAAGYTWLDKDADYGTADVDASFYALNFARHRATLALRYRFAGSFELRLDNEYRRQQSNPLREGDDNTFLAAFSLRWNDRVDSGLTVALTADNLTDSEFQPFPGTPAYGRHYSLSASYRW